MEQLRYSCAATAQPLHCSEPYAAEQVAAYLDRCVKRTVKRVYWALYRLREVHQVTLADAGWLLGVSWKRAIPPVPIQATRLRWSRAKGLVELQRAVDGGQVGKVNERADRRRVELGEEPEGSYRFGADWWPVRDALTEHGRVSPYYMARFAGFARLPRFGSEPMLDAGERLLLLRKLLASGALHGWGEKPERGPRRRREVRMLGEDGELPFVAISPGVNEAFSFPEGMARTGRHRRAAPTDTRPGWPCRARAGGAHRVEAEHPLIALAQKINEALSFPEETGLATLRLPERCADA